MYKKQRKKIWIQIRDRTWFKEAEPKASDAKLKVAKTNDLRVCSQIPL